MSRPTARLAATAAALALLAAATAARAQDLDETEEQPAAAARNNGFELAEANFDQWVFGRPTQPASGREQLDALLRTSLVEVDQACGLTEAQKTKLLLAGGGDIKRFLDRVAEARKVFDRFKHDQANINTIHQETIPLAAALQAGLFGPESFYFKTLATTLKPEQAARCREANAERDRLRHEAKARMAITNLDNVLGFTDEQRRRLTEVVLAETRPSAKPAGRYDSGVMLLKIAGIPEPRLRPIFDDARWRVLAQQFQQARSMERYYRSQGFLDDAKPLEIPRPRRD